MEFKWQRPSHIPFPNVWLTFKARDSESDTIVEYRIQDLPVDRFDDALEFMRENFIKNEPMRATAETAVDDIEDYLNIWRCVFNQRVTFACFKAGSDDILGLNLNFVAVQNEDFLGSIQEQVSFDQKC